MYCRVSVIIPVYNCEKYLKRAIESVVNQDNFCLDELILVDDGSTDSSGSICDLYSETYSNVKTIHQANAGVSAARNAGIEASDGEWIFFLDSDDYLLNGAMNKLLKYSDADLISGGYDSNKSSELNFSKLFDEGIVEIDLIKKYIDDILVTKKTFFNCWARLYKKRIIDDMGIEFPVNVKVAEDMVFVYTYLKHCHKLAFLHEPIYFYYINADNTTSVIPKAFDIDLYIYQWHKKFFSANIDCLNKLDYIFVQRSFNSIKTAAYYLPFHKSISYIKTILSDIDFYRCYSKNQMTLNYTPDKLLDKFIRIKNPYLIYFTVFYSKIKSKIYKLISGDKNDKTT